MIVWFGLIFLAVALAAAAFVVLPALAAGGSGGKPRRALVAGIAGLLVLMAGLGAYAGLGRPDFALMALRGAPRADNFQEAIAYLSQRIRERPNDVQGWSILGRGYLAFGAPDQAALAFERALDIGEARGDPPSPDLMVDYAIARGLVAGSLNVEVRGLLANVLEVDPGNADARYYLGLAHAEAGETAMALSLWDGLLADAPPDASWRAALPNQITALQMAGQAGAGDGGDGTGGEGTVDTAGGAPDVRAMVDGLAARLATEPEDINGWTMLIRAYSVLGEMDNARMALAQARQVFSGNDEAEAALTAQAEASALE
jgi:cytochrome c-type biogenesis protein CcmH